MMGAIERVKDGRGQSTVQVAICLPVLLLLLAFLLQVSWVLFCNVALDAGLEHVRCSIAEGDASTGELASSVIEEDIIAAYPVLASGELTVTDASVELVEGRNVTRELPDADFEGYRVASVNSAADRIAVKATVTYRPLQIVPVPMRVTLTRHVDSLKEHNMSFEIG